VIGASDYKNAFSAWKSTYKAAGGATVQIAIPPFCCKFRTGKTLSWKKILSIESDKNLTLTKIKDAFQPYWQQQTCLDYDIPDPNSAWTNQVIVSLHYNKHKRA